MSEMVFENFDHEAKALWGNHVLKLRHTLHERALFSDDKLGAILDQIPEHRMAINTMGIGTHDAGTWSYCKRGDLSGVELINAVQQGRIWINVTKIAEFVPEFSELMDEMFAEIEGNVPDLGVFRKSMGLLISSPNAQVFYHADVPGQALWQIRGEKRIWIYPNTEPFLKPKALEGIIRGTTEEEMTYQPWFDKYAEVIDLKPGDMAHWPLNGPHRVENKDCLNISVTTEHWTPEIRRHFAVQYGNGILRQFGWTPKSRDLYGPTAWAKIAMTAAWRLSGQQKRQAFKRQMRFKLDTKAPGLLVPFGSAA
ncbi:hypothetical protein [Pelagibacterium luteolum]|uniref:JmjC domain-containing protein n=1 Tax=Pelagibacterium luteolum TaxID=440168 RepID=A0A1G7RRV4_9HYPH|nr:hypothetical protein [Pelagibacterium luteolum]SDG13433.1 hypothetical protein SAMN04487974_10180 [Pelagibacterium luteolum]